MTDSLQIILIADDLMLGSTVSGHAAAHKVPFANVSTENAAAACKESSRLLVLVDLETAGLDVSTLAKSLHNSALQTAVAYGPHVHTDRLKEAAEAGFGHVVSRGHFSAQVGRIIADFANS